MINLCSTDVFNVFCFLYWTIFLECVTNMKHLYWGNVYHSGEKSEWRWRWASGRHISDPNKIQVHSSVSPLSVHVLTALHLLSHITPTGFVADAGECRRWRATHPTWFSHCRRLALTETGTVAQATDTCRLCTHLADLKRTWSGRSFCKHCAH